MTRKDTLKTLTILFGFIFLTLTAIDYLFNTLSITPNPVHLYWVQIFYFVCIMVFLILLIIYLVSSDR
ncbi:MAG: hypothetical protein ACFFCP_07065 [Promethearchaeota archaeon]